MEIRHIPILFLALLQLCCPLATRAQAKIKDPRILILLDGSSSMLEPWDENLTRFHAASWIILQLMDSVYTVNSDVEFGLRVYGHQSSVQDNNCYDTKLEVMFSKDNLTQMGLRLESLHPAGISPIAFSLKKATEVDFVNTEKYSYSLILITDGGESCNGNICATGKELLEKKIDFKPYVIGLVDHAPVREQYTCMGDYLLTNKPADVTISIETIINHYRKIIIPKQISKRPITKVKDDIDKAKMHIQKIDILNKAQISAKITPPKIEPITVNSIKLPDEENAGFGFVYFSNKNLLGTASLYLYEHGKYSYKKDINLPGISSAQKFKLEAGKYKIEYAGRHPAEFRIKNNMITELKLP